MTCFAGFCDAAVAPIDFPIAPAAAMPKVGSNFLLHNLGQCHQIVTITIIFMVLFKRTLCCKYFLLPFSY